MALAVVAAADTEPAIVVAALLYVWSDSVIALDAFLGLQASWLWLSYLTWPTYFVAQALFTWWATGTSLEDSFEARP